MSNVKSEEKIKVFETVLSSPGMSEKCKIGLIMSRQNILLLCRVIEAGFLTKGQRIDDEIIIAFPKDTDEEFRILHEEILKKAELSDFYEKLKAI